MHFLITAYDGTDPEAPSRRQAVRTSHLERAKKAKREGTIVFGGAILDEHDEMVGSALVVACESQADAYKWLEDDPYVTGGVWKDISIQPFLLASL